MRRLTVLLLGVVMAALSFAALPEAPDAEAHSLYDVRLVAQNSGKCLDIVDGNPNPLAKTHQWACGGWPYYPGGVVPWQQWDIVPYDGTWHFIKNRFSQLCLDVYGGTSEDVQLHQWTCNYTDAQKFTAPSCVGCWGEMRNKASNKCVDVYGAGVGDGVIILQTTCNGTRAQQWTADNHSPEKRLFTDRWYQRVADSGSYVTWMTLTFHRQGDPQLGPVWDGPITNAVNDWNSTPNTVYLAEVQPSSWNDIRTVVGNFNAGWLGRVTIYDEAWDTCPAGDCDAIHSRPNTWWYVFVHLNNSTHTGPFGTDFQRQATAAHELGHAIVLAHDGLVDGLPDGLCGPPGVPRTISRGAERPAAVGLLRHQPRLLRPRRGVGGMLARIFRPAALLALALAGLLSIALACQEGAEQNVPREPEQSVISQQASPEPQGAAQIITDRVTIGYARWPTLFAQSLATMVESYDTMIVGRVMGVTPEPVPLDPGPVGPLPPDHPKAKAPTPPPNFSSLRSVYSVEVVRVIGTAGVQTGATIAVVQDGGVVEGVAYELEGDPVIERGTTYLFFLQEGSPGAFFGAPFGRFRLDAPGNLAPVDEVWANLPAVKQLSGLTADEAAAVIEAAVAEAAAAPQP